MPDVAIRLRLMTTDRLWILLKRLHEEWERLGTLPNPDAAADRERTLEVFLLHGQTIAELIQRGYTREQIMWCLDDPRA